MIYKEIELPIPQKKRIQKTTGYVYEILKRKNKNIKKDEVMLIGRLSKNGLLNPNENYFTLHPDKGNIPETSKEEPGEFSSTLHIGNYLLFKRIADDIGLANVISSSLNGYKDVIMSLVSYYLSERESATQLYQYYAFNHFTGLNYVPSEASISNLFKNKLDHDAIMSFLTKWMEINLKNKKDIHIDIDFDSTNNNASSKYLSLTEFGKPKLDEGLPQYNIAYFFDRRTGLPIFYDVYYGSIIDMSHCKTAIDKVHQTAKDAAISFVLDRGYFSKINIDYINESKYEFTCLGKVNKCFKKYISEHSREEICKSMNYIDNELFGIKFIGKAFENDKKDYNIYLFYNELEEIESFALIAKAVKYYSSFLVGKLDPKRNLERSYGNYINLTYDENDIVIEASINNEAMDEYKKHCGYFWIFSNQDVSPKEIYKLYRDRDVVEKMIRSTKSGSDLSKCFAQSDKVIEAKTLLGFICAAIRSYIILKMTPYKLQYSSETSQTLIKEIDKIQVEKIGNQYISRYALTARQRQILALFGLKYSDVIKAIKELNETMKIAKC